MTTKQQRIRDNFERNNFKNQLVWLNAGNDAGATEIEMVERVLDEFPDEKLTALEVGCAYGGGTEFIAKCWYGRGRVYGYDTFVGHPKDLAASPDDLDATCMDMWYDKGKEIPALHVSRLAYDYQRKVLDDQLLTNAILVKGRVNKHSFDNIKKIHFAMLDLDFDKPMTTAYHAIKDKFVPGGYLMLHDTLPPDHLPKICHLAYNVIAKDGRWSIIKEVIQGDNSSGATVFKRKLR